MPDPKANANEKAMESLTGEQMEYVVNAVLEDLREQMYEQDRNDDAKLIDSTIKLYNE